MDPKQAVEKMVHQGFPRLNKVLVDAGFKARLASIDHMQKKVFLSIFVPDTRNISKEVIDDVFDAMKKWDAAFKQNVQIPVEKMGYSVIYNE